MSRFTGPFTPRHDGIAVLLGEPERDLLIHLLGQLDELLDDGRPVSSDPLEELTGMLDPSAPPPQPSDDPAVARLLPDASRDDAEAAAEFRRLTEGGLRNRKRAGARRAAEALAAERPVLSPDDAQALLKALTDLRLVLADRLGLKTDEDAERLHEELAAAGPDDGGRVAVGMTYDALTWWQESLVTALLPR